MSATMRAASFPKRSAVIRTRSCCSTRSRRRTPNVFNILLQVLDDGRLTDNKGRTVDFRNTIIIMTSNVGSRAVVRKSVQVGYSTTSKSAVADRTPQSEYCKALEHTFAPEFLNRIDDIVLFRTLEIADVERIVDLELQGLMARTGRLGYKVKITEGPNAGWRPWATSRATACVRSSGR